MGGLRIDTLGDFIDTEASADRFSGSVAMEVGDQRVFEGAYGHAHQGFRVRNTPTTRFNTASITKMFTAVAVLQLVEDGSLSLDTTVAHLLPDVRVGMADRMTVDHLLRHKSGLGDYWNDRCRARRSTLRTIADYLELVDGAWPAFEPGTSTAYGNSGYVLLGAIVEQVTGDDYYDRVRRHVCAKAGLESARHVHLDRVSDVAHGYTHIEWEGAPHPDYRTDNIFQYPVHGSPATGLYATAADLLTFFRSLRNSELLGERLVAAMLADERNGGLSYGTQRVPYSAGVAVGHGGRAFGAATILLHLPERDATVCILSNYDRPADKVVFARIDELLSEV